VLGARGDRRSYPALAGTGDTGAIQAAE